MRPNYSDDPTADPVELERQLIFGGQRAPDGSQVAPQGPQPYSPSRIGFLGKLSVALSIALIIGYLLIWARTVQDHGGPEGYVHITDFVSNLTGATIISEGNGPGLYDLQTQRDAQDSLGALIGGKLLPYNHLPFEAMLLSPLMGLPDPIVFALWTLVAGVCIGFSLGIMDGALPVARSTGWVLSLAACSYLPLIRALMLGQNTPFVLLGLCGVYAAIKRDSQGWAGAAMLLVALKPQILPIVGLVLLLQGKWKAIGTFVGFIAALSVAIMPVLGVGWPVQYAQLLLGVANWADASAIDPAIMHNWRGFFTDLVGGSAPGLVTPLFVLLSLASAGLVVWVWWRRDEGRTTNDEGQGEAEPEHTWSFDLLWALTGIVAVLTSLHLNPHDLALLIFPAWIIAAYATSGVLNPGTSRLLVALLWAGYALFPVTQLVTAANPGISVVPSVLLMAGVALLLAWRLGGQPRIQEPV